MSASYITSLIKTSKSRRLGIFVTLLMTSSCASMGIQDFFVSYSQQLEPTRKSIQANDIPKAIKELPQRSPDHNAYALSLLNQGRLNYLANDWEFSQKVFTQADKKITEDDNKAKIQISRGLKKVGALASNDSAIPYDVPYYERSMLHTYQALNYAYKRDFEGALIEVRRANIVQTEALKAYESEILDAKEDMSKAGVDYSKATSAYPSMQSIIGKVKNGFQNAYTFYLSGVLYEATGEPNDAYIDYKKALEIFPDNKYLQQDVLRLASRLGMQDDLARYQKKYGKYNNSANKSSGEVVIFYEEGLVSSKSDVSLNLPIFTSSGNFRTFNFSLPVYGNNKRASSPLKVAFENKHYNSEEIVQIQALAAKNLEEQLPSLITRQALRLVSKEQIRQQANHSGGDVGNLLASLYNIASEKADTRSWSTLPAQVGIVRLNIPEGEHDLRLTVAGKNIPLNIKVNPNRITLINVSAIEHYTNYQTLNL